MNVDINGSIKKLKSICVGQDNKIVKIYDDLSFGQDSDGNWGYIIPGSDTVTPFGSGGSIAINKWVVTGGEEYLENISEDNYYVVMGGYYTVSFAINVSSSVSTIVNVRNFHYNSNYCMAYLNGKDIGLEMRATSAAIKDYTQSIELLPGVNNLVFQCTTIGEKLQITLPPIAI